MRNLGTASFSGSCVINAVMWLLNGCYQQGTPDKKASASIMTSVSIQIKKSHSPCVGRQSRQVYEYTEVRMMERELLKWF